MNRETGLARVPKSLRLPLDPPGSLSVIPFTLTELSPSSALGVTIFVRLYCPAERLTDFPSWLDPQGTLGIPGCASRFIANLPGEPHLLAG